MKPAALWQFLPQFNDGYQAPSTYVPVYSRCLTAVWRRIRNLGLAGIAPTSIVLRKVAWSREFAQGQLSLPGVIVSPEGSESMPLGSGTNLRDDIGYAVLVTILTADNEQIAGSLKSPLEWRETIARAFSQQPLPDVEEVIRCTVEPRAVVGPDAYQRGLLQSSLVLRFVSRERRGQFY
ncbi:MAG: hypothetical protein JNM18_21445 [Planctomycetaceae bacterium]|nr:hypothetical protein [Planctomycetaceae bacterium]